MESRPAIELEGLSKAFRVRRARETGLFSLKPRWFAPEERVVAIDGVSFRIAPGERVAFIGPNGAGKSTTLKVLSGILRPDAGQARVLGFVPWRERRALGFQIGTVFGQRSQLWYQLPARDTFELLGHVYELAAHERRARLTFLIETFALGDLLDRPVRQLSLGERMRCEIAASLLHAPEILFLDEPTIGLDVTAKAAIRDVLRNGSFSRGATLLLTSHDTVDIEQVCDRAIVIHKGRVLSDGPIAELRRGYLDVKRITLFTAARDFELDLPGVRVIERRPHQTTLEVELARTEIGAVIERAVRGGSLRDLRIDDPPLEEVIRALYQRAERASAP